MGKFMVTDYLADLDTAATREHRYQPRMYTNGKNVKTVIEVVASVSVSVLVYESTKKTQVAGNLLRPQPIDRESSELSAVIACHTPGAGAVGDLIFSGISAAGIPCRFPADEEHARLLRGRPYLLLVTGLADNNRVNIQTMLYEEPFADLTLAQIASSSSRSSSSSSSSSTA